MHEDSSSSDESSDEDEEEPSPSPHYQFLTKKVKKNTGVQSRQSKMAQMMFYNENESKAPLDLREVMLLDSESTMDLFCNKTLVSGITKSKGKLRVQGNGGTMVVT